MIMDFRSGPIMTLSLAYSKSIISTFFLLNRAALRAASLTRLARSAPENPGVPRAMTVRSTFSASGVERVCTLRICSRPRRSGRSTTTRRSNRPGRRRAGSSTSGRFVAATRITPSLVSKPSISTSRAFSVCSRSSCPPPSPAPRCRPTASISSMKMMQGAFFLPCSKRSRTREAPTPTNISTKSEPEIVKNGTFASPATARAERFPRAGRADEQDALGDLAAELLELLRILEELDDFLKLDLGFFDARDILERHLFLRRRQELRPRLAEGEGLVPAGLHLPH